MHNLAPDLWAVYGVPWTAVDGLWWDEFALMVIHIDARRREAARQRNG